MRLHGLSCFVSPGLWQEAIKSPASRCMKLAQSKGEEERKRETHLLFGGCPLKGWPRRSASLLRDSEGPRGQEAPGTWHSLISTTRFVFALWETSEVKQVVPQV